MTIFELITHFTNLDMNIYNRKKEFIIKLRKLTVIYRKLGIKSITVSYKTLDITSFSIGNHISHYSGINIKFHIL